MDAAQSVEETTEVIHSNISCLFTEILVLIFCHLDVRSKGRAARVCSSWRNAAYERRVWRSVEARLHMRSSSPQLFASLVRRGINCVQVMISNRNHKNRHVLCSDNGNRTFRPFDVSPPGRFATRTFRPKDVSPLYVSPPGRFAHSLNVSPPTVDVSPPSACLCVCCFLEHRNVTDGWTHRIAINISHKCGDTR